MTFLEALLWGSFGVTLAGWIGLSGYTLVRRVVHDARRRTVLATRARRRSARAIARRRARATARVDAIVRAAGSHRGEIRKWRRISALGRLARMDRPETMPLLVQALHDDDRDVVGAAVTILGTVRDRQAAELLVQALRTSAYTPSRIASALDHFPVPIFDLVRSLPHSSDPNVRYWGATLLARYGGADRVDADLAEMVADEDPRVRKAAVESLGKIGGGTATRAAARLLNDPVFFVRAHAIRALGQLRDPDLVALVAPALADSQWWVRMAAKHALLAGGPAIAPQLVPYLEHPDAFARNGAAEVLQDLGMLDRWATEAIAAPGDPAPLEQLRKAYRAGGAGMMDAMLERARPTVVSDVAALLVEVRREPGGLA